MTAADVSSEHRVSTNFYRIIDTINDWAGRIFSYLLIPMVLLTVYDVVLRYIFNKPTFWAWDINVQLLGVMIAMGGGYALLHNSHTNVDFLVEKQPRRRRAIIDLITFPFFFVGIGVLLWRGGQAAAFAVQIREVDSTFFAPPVYPLKVIIVLGFFLLFLQGIVKFAKDLTIVFSAKSRVDEEVVQ